MASRETAENEEAAFAIETPTNGERMAAIQIEIGPIANAHHQSANVVTEMIGDISEEQVEATEIATEIEIATEKEKEIEIEIEIEKETEKETEAGVERDMVVSEEVTAGHPESDLEAETIPTTCLL